MKVRYIIMAAAVALGLQGCSDWDDHYDANGDNIAGANATLWEQINSRPELSNFATLLKKVGYDEVLNTNQSYTVWAPNNNAYDFETYNAMSDSLLKAEFLDNHIARGYHRASGNTSERVHFLNKKVLAFAGDGDYTLGGLAIDSTNIVSKNGMMHLLEGVMEFRPNFYEFFNREHNDGFKSSIIGDLFKSNMKREMDKDNSVEGPMKDGEITYLDTVYVESNKWFDRLGAKLTEEDSTYTMVIPSDVAWEKAYKHIEPFFNLPTTIQPFTLQNDDKTGVLTYTIAGRQEIAADSLKRTYTQLGILAPLVYSNTINPAIRDGKLPEGATDSIRCTYGNRLYNTYNFQDPNSSLVYDAKELFTGTKKVTLSNGVAYLTGDSLYERTWTGINPTMRVRAMSGSSQAGISNVSLAQNVTLNEDARNPKVHGSIHATAFYQVTSNINAQPQVYFYGPALNSTSYAVYLTMIPQNITDTTAVPVDQRIQLRALSHAASGNAPSASSSTGLPSFATLKRDFNSNSNQASVTFSYGTKDDAKIVSKFVGIYKPNICYNGLTTSPSSRPVFNVNCTTRTAGGSTVLRIAAITFVPQEAVEYYMKEGYIDSYTGDMPEMFWNLPTSTY